MTAYPAYTKIEADWITQLPSHWSALPVKYVCTYNDEVLSEGTEPSAVIQYVEISDVDQANGLRGNEAMTFRDAPSRARRLVRDGDVIISTVRTYLRAVAPITSPPENLVVSTGFAVIRPDGLAPAFARYALVADGFVGSVIARSTGVSYPAINASDLVRIPVPVPPIEEQLAIASYLDDETRRIDGLIEEKQRLANMLTDLRGGVIRERTTGADVVADQLATGDVFMPQLSAGWSLVALGRYSRITNGSTPLKDNPNFWHGGHYPWLNSSVVNGDEVTEGSELVTAEALRLCHLPIVPAGSVLVALTGQGKTRGQATVLRIEATINQHLAAIVCDEDHLDGEFVFWALTGQYAALRMVSDGQGGTKGALTCDELGRFRIPKPPIEVQRSIARALYEETRRIDELLEHVGAEVAMLKELRSATITDAVLGRIDVRSHMKN
jgi:type I restriction enzyme S subunit